MALPVYLITVFASMLFAINYTDPVSVYYLYLVAFTMFFALNTTDDSNREEV